MINGKKCDEKSVADRQTSARLSSGETIGEGDFDRF